MMQVKDALAGLRCKLGMMSICISCHLYIHGNNMSVVYNTSKPKSVLQKKNNAVCYNAVFKSVSIGKPLVGHTPSSENVADLMIKVLHVQRRQYLVIDILHDIHDDHYAPVTHQGCNKERLITLVIVSILSEERCGHNSDLNILSGRK